ncbi:MAG: PKD domain-containing protein [Muribaculaceae bacterium]|nr:PKD domain-containing protein [Muribaculaceae bacterium]
MITPLLILSPCVALLSPYIANVYEYSPAPGQFVNLSPEYEEGDTYADILAKASEELCGDRNPGIVSLGSFGGFVVFGFDHPVVNVEGEDDFKVYGNAIASSSEPGVVSVSADTNGNGLPDDEWYDLAGSEHSSSATLRGVEITYSRPEPGHTPVTDPDRPFITDAEYSRWTASDGTSGYVMTVDRHTQPYWPLWLQEAASLTFRGTLLPPNGIDRNGKGTLYDFKVYDWGYADNKPNTDPEGFNIGNAVDMEGNPVHLDQVDFIRVHTGTNQQCGWLGETSTEVCGAEDLHPDAQPSGVNGIAAEAPGWRLCRHAGSVAVECDHPVTLRIYSPDGTLRHSLDLPQGMSPLPALPSGLHILCAEGHAERLVR